MAKEPLKVNVMVRKDDEIVPYDSLTAEEKADLGKKMNQRAIRAAAHTYGLEVDFVDLPPKTETA